MIKNTIAKSLWLASLLLLLGSWAWAQSSDDGNQSNSSPETNTSAAQSSDEDDGGFTPTEEISEDLSVSFPIDI